MQENSLKTHHLFLFYTLFLVETQSFNFFPKATSVFSTYPLQRRHLDMSGPQASMDLGTAFEQKSPGQVFTEIAMYCGYDSAAQLFKPKRFLHFVYI